MSDDLWIRIFIYGLIGGLVGLLARKRKLRPNKSAEIDGALRLPKITGVMGWIIISLSLPLILLSFAAPEEARIPILIGGLLIAGLGVLLVVYYKIWYIHVLADEIVVRKLSGRIVRIRYDSVKWVKLTPNGAAPALRIKGLNGERIDVNSKMVDTQTIISKIEYFQTGRQKLQGMPHPQGHSQFPAPQGPAPQGPSPYGQSPSGQAPYGQLPPPTSPPFGQEQQKPSN